MKRKKRSGKKQEKNELLPLIFSLSPRNEEGVSSRLKNKKGTMCDDSPSSLVPRSAFFDVEAPVQQCSPRKGARIANGEGGAGGSSKTARDADATAGGVGGGTTPVTATKKPPPPKRVSFASHVQVSSSSSSSLTLKSPSRSRREQPKKTKGGDEEEGGEVEEEDSGRMRSLVFSALLLIAVCAGLFAAGWSARGKTSSKPTIVEGDLWQAAPSRGETVLGELLGKKGVPQN